MVQGVVIAAPTSGAGKTTVTLALLRLLRQRGFTVQGAKSGPDYIDPRFHAAAAGRECVNLDAWAMTPARIKGLAAAEDILIVEGAMGLFDGAPPDGKGSAADLARILNLPVVLVVDCARMGHSVAALVHGFQTHDPAVKVAGLILNNTGSARHEAMLDAALAPLGLPVIAKLRRNAQITQPARHLGLVQAQERADLEAFLDLAADHLAQSFDQQAYETCLSALPGAAPAPGLAAPAQRIAVARDAAFGFTYPHVLQDWRAAGAEISFFSPLADDPVPEADFVYLPGGYPELHAGQLAANSQFMKSLRSTPVQIYGECGGFMVLGDGLIDAEGHRHQMAGLLRLETSFAERKLHLGYRDLVALGGPFFGSLRGHEFHYATTLKTEGAPLYEARNAEGDTLAPMGLINGAVSGSFAHVIDQALHP